MAVCHAPGSTDWTLPRRVRRQRWLSHACDWAVRLATLAAGLCPALSSLGGAVVGVLLAVTACVDSGAVEVAEVLAARDDRPGRPDLARSTHAP
jgi:hypothetical protein